MNTKAILRTRLAHSFVILALAGASPVLAQPVGADGDDFLYRVVQGDTLLDVSGRFTDKARNWTLLKQINQVADEYRLPIGKLLKIPFSMIPERPAPAEIVHVRGQVTVNGRSVRSGASLPEGGTLITPPGGFATLRLSDGSTLTVPANSAIAVDRLQAFQGTGLTDTIISVNEGSVESIVAPEQTGVGRFEVRTPVAITGVRGTRLRVHKQNSGVQTEVLSGVAQTSATTAGTATLKSGQGVITRADGVMQVVQPLPAAPKLSVPVRGPQGWHVEFAPISGAKAYLVRVAEDPEGTRLLSSRQYVSPDEIRFSATKSGTHYLLIRAVAHDGLMGADAVQPFEGRPTLRTIDDAPVMTGQGDYVTLTEY